MAIEINQAVVEYFGTPTNTSHTINLSTASPGDVRVVVIAANPDGTGAVPTVNIPSGWTQIGSQLNTGAASDGMLCIIYRVVQSGDATTLVTTYTQTCMVATICTTYEGVDNSTPIDQTTPTFGTGTGNPVCPTITTQTNGARVGRACLIDGAPAGFGDTSNPAGTTLRGTMVNNPPSNGQNLGHADEEQVTAGSAGTATWSDGATEEYVAATFALRPEPLSSSSASSSSRSSSSRSSSSYSSTSYAAKTFKMVSSLNVSNNTNTTAQLTAPLEGSFITGKVYTTQNPGAQLSFLASQYTEFEFCILVLPSAENGAQYEFRLSNAKYDVYPKLTIAI